MKTTLSKHHHQTFDAIFQHPLATGLSRRDVLAMLGEVGQVQEEHNGNFKITRNDQTMVLHASLDKEISNKEELMAIRHFLQRSGDPAAQAKADAGHVLVVLDHREARIFQTEMRGTVPARITPIDPHGFGRNLRYVQDDSNGQRKPEQKSFYEAIATSLETATHILLFGSGTGASSAMEQLLTALQERHPQVASRVVGSVAVDAQHLTEEQLLARAREFYEKREPVVAAK